PRPPPPTPTLFPYTTLFRSEPASEFILTYFGPEIESAASGDTGGNYKSLLQQFAQREHGVTPTYHLMDEKGPDHSKCFKMSASQDRKSTRLNSSHVAISYAV